jgi:hypothetical protein
MTVAKVRGEEGISARVAALSSLSHETLIAEWRRLYRSPPPKRVSRSLLELVVAWKIQESALGGLQRSTMRRLAETIRPNGSTGGVVEPRSVTLKPGARLVREWRGETHDVLAVDGGFEWRGRIWRSLSEIAREITGTRWSGPRFFGLEKPRPEVADEQA